MNGGMDMKRLASVMTLLTMILLLLCSPASADVITAMAIEINPEHLEKTASYARILGYNEDSNILTLELIVPESFAADDVQSLQAGDSIYTGGQEVVVKTIKKEWDEVVINESSGELSDEFVLLYKEGFGDVYHSMTRYDDNYCWLSLGEIECPVTDSLLFLDYIGAEWGEPLCLPIVRTGQMLMDCLRKELDDSSYSVGLSCDNVYVVFDGEGNLATIQRFYVPWQ